MVFPKRLEQTDIFSATSPLHYARKTTLFYLPSSHSLPTLSELLAEQVVNEHLLSNALRTCIQIMMMYGLRASEVLSITSSAHIGAGRVFVPGAKGSRGTVLFLPDSIRFFAAAAGLGAPVRVFPFSYNELYRACVKIGIGKQLADHENLARTHSSRYIIARRVAEQCGVDGAQDALRHKRATSTAYYL